MLENESSRSLCGVTFRTQSGTSSQQTVSSSWDFSCVYFPSSPLGCQLSALGCQQFQCSSPGRGCVRWPTQWLPASPKAWLGSQSGNCWREPHHLRSSCPLTQPTPQPGEPGIYVSPLPSHLQSVLQGFLLPSLPQACALWLLAT